MRGRDLARAIAPRWPDIHILYVSGSPDDAIVHHGVPEPGTGVLQNPFTPRGNVTPVTRASGGVAPGCLAGEYCVPPP
jgi:hypothetical protein